MLLRKKRHNKIHNTFLLFILKDLVAYLVIHVFKKEVCLK